MAKKNIFQIDNELHFRANIKVVGVGGGGCNAIKTMSESGLSGVEFISANTDLQALEELDLSSKIQLGAELTKGLGAGANPEIGRRSAIESCESIANALKSADMVFITAGMGGGTGTGAAGVIAGIAKKQGALTLGVVTRPFFFEGRRRARHAETGIQFLKENVDTLIVIPNQKLFKTVDESTSLLSAFKEVDNVLLKAVKGISDLVNQKGLINLDFSDVQTIMSEKGLAIIGTGEAQGENRSLTAARLAVSSPLLEESSFKGARGIIINITGGKDLSLVEVNQIAEVITQSAHADAEIIFGAVVDPQESTGRIRVTVIATGFASQVHHSPSHLDPSKNNRSNRSSGESSLAHSSSTSGVAPGVRLSKDVLLEKARAYQTNNHANHAVKPSNSQQLSMDILDPTKKIAPSIQPMPFEKNKKRTFLVDLFKRPISSKGHRLPDKEG